MEPTTRVVTLAHYHILQEMREHWATFYDSEHTARLAKICMAYLSLDKFSTGPCHDMSTFREHLEEHPFLYYTSHYRGYHARAALLLGTCEADVHCFLESSRAMNVELSLQISEYNPEDKQRPLELHPNQYLGLSALQIASRHGLGTIVRDILKTDPDMISKVDRNGKTALHEAALAGWEDIVSILIEAMADCSSTDNDGKTPFNYAAERGNAKVISILQDEHVRNGDGQKTLEEALCDAAEAGNTGVVRELLKLDVDSNAIKHECSAIAKASRRGHKVVVRMLLEKGANPSYLGASPDDSSIPLHQAIRHGHFDVAALLLDYGADIEARDERRRTALFETLNTADTRGAALAALLLNFGIDISSRDTMGNGILYVAAEIGAFEHASRFVDRGSNRSQTLVLHTAGARHTKIFSLLVVEQIHTV